MFESAVVNETAWRLACFAGVLVTAMVWEAMAPRRRRDVHLGPRLTSNLAIAPLNVGLVRLILPLSAVAFAELTTARGWGLFNAMVLPPWLVLVLAVVALDLVVYLQHVMFHAVPAFWRLHRMHHADQAFDVTTGLRFHPLEILLSMGVKFAAILVLGAPAVAVLAFEILLNATAMFNHANARLPAALDRALRWIVVTPNMHRAHHSIHPRETNSNFGFCLTWWDRLLGTWRAQPVDGHEDMTIGIDQFQTRRD